MEALALHIVAPTVHFEENTCIIYVVEDKTVTYSVKYIEITVCFIQ